VRKDIFGMNKKELYEFITANPIGYMATVDGDKPHVRGMAMYRADEDGIIYYTNYTKNVCKQLLVNPETEVCYFSDGLQLRVSGRVEELNDNALKQEVVEKFPFLKPRIEKHGLEHLAIFKLKPTAASTWSLKNMTDFPIEVDI
jgi:uncharacterized pyridoxamine 5'-phosphate oxidase family protein